MERIAHPRPALAAFVAVLAVKVGLAGHWGLLADEAWYVAWSEALASGYYDQPPAIAWVIAVERALLGEGALAIRAVPIACTAVVAGALYRSAGDRAFWLGWCALVPAVAWLGLFATPDSLLLACWAVALAGALRGGRGWLVAGLAAGLAFEAKHTGALVLPLLWLALPTDRRSPRVAVGAGLALVLAAPNLLWNARHDWQTVRFQLGEGLLHPSQPGLVGVALQLLGQILVATPVLGICGLAWIALRSPGPSSDRVHRVAWWTSAPLLALFAIAAAFAPGEAHWPAPAWVGIGLGLSHEGGAWARARWLGLGLAAALVAVLGLHTLSPVASLPIDPATRLTEGPVLARMIEQIASDPERATRTAIVYTERYQEAGFIRHYAQIPAAVHPGCGRPGQQDLWGDPHAGASRAVFVRPVTHGPPDCLSERWRTVRGPIRLEGVDPSGRDVGPWEIFELEAR